MKARVKATGEIFDIECVSLRLTGKVLSSFGINDVEVLMPDLTPNFWTRLEHQYAGMAMQGMLNNSLLITSLLKVNKSHEDIVDEVTSTAIRYAHALVQKLKEKEERK